MTPAPKTAALRLSADTLRDLAALAWLSSNPRVRSGGFEEATVRQAYEQAEDFLRHRGAIGRARTEDRKARQERRGNS